MGIPGSSYPSEAPLTPGFRFRRVVAVAYILCMRRVAIIGPSGAGKTTLALELGKRLGIELVELDRLLWKPGWVERPLDECERIQEDALTSDGWVVDSASPRGLRSRLHAADTIVFLDVPAILCALRALVRRIRTRGRLRTDMAPGCPPSRLDRAVVNRLWYVRRYRRDLRPLFLQELSQLTRDHHVVVLRNSRDVRDFVASVG
jgi:adenylate kinase family enzyme